MINNYLLKISFINIIYYELYLPEPWECKIKTFTHKSVYERHLKTNCGKPKEPTVCDICGKCFKYPSKLQEHLNNKKKCSPPEKNYVYKKCSAAAKQAVLDGYYNFVIDNDKSYVYLNLCWWFDFVTDYPKQVRNKINDKNTSIQKIVEMLLIPIFDINPGLIKNYGFEEWQIDSKSL